MLHLESVVVVSVLVGVGLRKIMVPVNGGDDVNVVMGCVRMGAVVHVVELFVTVKFGEDCFWMLIFNSFDVGDVTEVQFVDNVAYVESLYMLVDHQTRKYVLVGVGADVKVARHFLNSERPHQPASIVFLECLFSHFVLFHLIGLP